MSAQRLEAFLAALYVGQKLRRRFIADPINVARDAGFDEKQSAELAKMDMVGLVMASRSFEKKRERKEGVSRPLR